MPKESEGGSHSLRTAKGGGTSQTTKRVQASDTHELASAKGAINQFDERVRPRGRHSHTGTARGSVGLEEQKKASERGALTDCGAQREEQVKRVTKREREGDSLAGEQREG
jgi:hypothetical protein